MTGIKTILFSDYDSNEINKCINSFLSRNADYDIVDIKFSTTGYGQGIRIEYSALVIYRENPATITK